MTNELTDHEQLVEAIYKMANVVKIYHDALIECGFSEAIAAKLAADFQNDLISGGMKNITNGNDPA